MLEEQRAKAAPREQHRRRRACSAAADDDDVVGRIAGERGRKVVEVHGRAHFCAPDLVVQTGSRWGLLPEMWRATYCASRPTPSMKLERRVCWKRCPSTYAPGSGVTPRYWAISPRESRMG